MDLCEREARVVCKSQFQDMLQTEKKDTKFSVDAVPLNCFILLCVCVCVCIDAIPFNYFVRCVYMSDVYLYMCVQGRSCLPQLLSNTLFKRQVFIELELID